MTTSENWVVLPQDAGGPNSVADGCSNCAKSEALVCTLHQTAASSGTTGTTRFVSRRKEIPYGLQSVLWNLCKKSYYCSTQPAQSLPYSMYSRAEGCLFGEWPAPCALPNFKHPRKQKISVISVGYPQSIMGKKAKYPMGISKCLTSEKLP
jgi:hypothetical protein